MYGEEEVGQRRPSKNLADGDVVCEMPQSLRDSSSFFRHRNIVFSFLWPDVENSSEWVCTSAYVELEHIFCRKNEVEIYILHFAPYTWYSSQHFPHGIDALPSPASTGDPIVGVTFI